MKPPSGMGRVSQSARLYEQFGGLDFGFRSKQSENFLIEHYCINKQLVFFSVGQLYHNKW